MFVYVNNKCVETEKKYTILQLCSSIGIEIPRFCYHPKLSIAANCRMCLIQLEDSLKPVAACAVGISESMRFHTNTSAVRKAREGVLEFLLINHPLDCPICDQGGECDLQDQTMVFGSDRGRFYEKKRAVKDFFSGPFIKTFMTRCIHCTRCVRFNSEIEDEHVLGTLGRGQTTSINTYVKKSLDSTISGNLVDICPVGALTAKNQSFALRPWELASVRSIDPFSKFQSKIRVDFRGNEIMRIIPGEGLLRSKNWVSNKTRLMFDGLSYQRMIQPFMKDKYSANSWEEVVLMFSIIFASKNIFSSISKFYENRQIYYLNFIEREIFFLYQRKNIFYSKRKQNCLQILKKRGKFS